MLNNVHKQYVSKKNIQGQLFKVIGRKCKCIHILLIDL